MYNHGRPGESARILSLSLLSSIRFTSGRIRVTLNDLFDPVGRTYICKISLILRVTRSSTTSVYIAARAVSRFRGGNHAARVRIGRSPILSAAIERIFLSRAANHRKARKLSDPRELLKTGPDAMFCCKQDVASGRELNFENCAKTKNKYRFP